MRKIHVAEADSIPNRPARRVTDVAGSLGATDLGFRYYELDPGDSIGRTFHKHDDQEELFYVEQGTATFETEEGRISVGPGEIVRFAPGDYQRGFNDSDEVTVVLGLGAPAGSEDVTRKRHCEECGELTELTFVEEGEEIVSVCDRCGTENGRW